MAAKYRIDPEKFSTVLTSCGRFDLLEETIRSFESHFDTNSIIVAEDADRPLEAAAFAALFAQVQMRVNAPKLGQMRSIDRLYETLATPYAVHLEDDWGFTRTIDLDSVVRFLEARSDISVVCIAHRVYHPRFSGGAKPVRHEDIDYLVWDLNAHHKWFSYSFNPSVVPLRLWHQFGPFSRFVTEENLSEFCKSRGLRIAMVTPGIADHIGDHRHSPDPFQPLRPKTPFAKLKRSLAKRWAELNGKPTNRCP
jgi:hypothetical protein